jgi:hypothetical protein
MFLRFCRRNHQTYYNYHLHISKKISFLRMPHLTFLKKIKYFENLWIKKYFKIFEK